MRFICKDINLKLNILSKHFDKFKGLMFKRNKITEAYLLKNCNSIHTFFMKQNIDILITDKNYKVLYKKDNVTKNKIIIKNKGKHTFELPIGTVKNINIGDAIKIED